jgi:hypothetical protein
MGLSYTYQFVGVYQQWMLVEGAKVYLTLVIFCKGKYMSILNCTHGELYTILFLFFFF